MACCYCGSNMHDTENCRWNGTGKRFIAAVVLALVAGCSTQVTQAAEPQYLNDRQSRFVKEIMQNCGKIVMEAAESARKDGVEVTGKMMDKAYQQCLIGSGATI